MTPEAPQPDITVVETQPDAPSVVVVEKPIVDGSLSATEIILVGVLLIVVVGGGYALKTLMEQNKELGNKLHDAVPPWLWDSIQRGVEGGLGQLGTIVEATPNPIDDNLYERFRRLEQQFFEWTNAKSEPSEPTSLG